MELTVNLSQQNGHVAKGGNFLAPGPKQARHLRKSNPFGLEVSSDGSPWEFGSTEVM